MFLGSRGYFGSLKWLVYGWQLILIGIRYGKWGKWLSFSHFWTIVFQPFQNNVVENESRLQVLIQRGGQGVRTPPGKSQVIWVSIGNKHRALDHPILGPKFNPIPNAKKYVFIPIPDKKFPIWPPPPKKKKKIFFFFFFCSPSLFHITQILTIKLNCLITNNYIIYQEKR